MSAAASSAMPDLEGRSADAFWQELYARQRGETSGRPTHTLPRHVADRAPGDALDLGCARGDDAVWLAKQGWRVLGVDIAEAALEHSRANARRNGVADRVRTERHDLSLTFPEGRFDLVTASFLQTPFDFAWGRVMHRAAMTLRTGGLLLAVTHQRVAPWSWSSPDEDRPDAEALLSSIGLDETEWSRVFVGPVDRIATHPDGDTAPVTDAVIALEKLRETPE